jgi:hypothetical protein
LPSKLSSIVPANRRHAIGPSANFSMVSFWPSAPGAAVGFGFGWLVAALGLGPVAGCPANSGAARRQRRLARE